MYLKVGTSYPVRFWYIKCSDYKRNTLHMYLDLFTASQPLWANICSHTIMLKESSVITNSINIECWWIKYRDTGVPFPEWLSQEKAVC